MLTQILGLLAQDFPWKNQILHFDSVDSTNTLAKNMAAQGAPSGTIILADGQTCGKGRLGRSFLSPGGTGIYMSVLLRPQCKPDALMHLTCATAVAVCDAVEAACGLRPGIKWTNDLVCNKRKLGGILTELSVSSQTGLADYAVVGIGINCLQQPEDFAPEIREIAGSLQMLCPHPVSRAALSAEIIRAMYRMSETLLTQATAWLEQYRRDCITVGNTVSVVRGENIRHAVATGIDDKGALLVRYPDGTTEAVNSGEVSIRGMYGYV